MSKPEFSGVKVSSFQGGEKGQVPDAADGSEKMRNESWPLHLVTREHMLDEERCQWSIRSRNLIEVGSNECHSFGRRDYWRQKV